MRFEPWGSRIMCSSAEPKDSTMPKSIAIMTTLISMKRIIPAIAGVLMLALLLSLGFWQLDRAAEKRVLIESFAEGQQASPRPVATTVELADLPRYERVELRGHYEPERQGLLDVQMHRGRAGYRVWTPFRPDAGGLVLVDRGWVPASQDRVVLPEIAVEDMHRVITGLVSPLPEPGLRLGSADQGESGWPRRLHWPDAAALERIWGEGVAPVIVLLDDGSEDGFVREWAPATAIPPERHLAYAVQWFGLAVALVVIVLVLVLCRKETDDG